MNRTRKEWTVNRLFDTLSKYSNHKILSIKIMENKIVLQIEYISEKFNSKVITYVNIYADGESE